LSAFLEAVSEYTVPAEVAETERRNRSVSSRHNARITKLSASFGRNRSPRPDDRLRPSEMNGSLWSMPAQLLPSSDTRITCGFVIAVTL